MMIMISIAAAWALAVLWLLRKYKASGDKGSLKSAGALVGLGALVVALGLDYNAVIFEERADWPYLVFFAGVIITGLMSAAASEPGKKWSSAGGTLVFFFFGMFLITMFPSHGMHRPLRNGHAMAECGKLLPMSSYQEVAGQDKAARLAMAARLGEALVSDKRFVPLGALCKLCAYPPEEAVAAMPGVIAFISSKRGDEYEIAELRRLLLAMGPAAAQAAPALEARIAGNTGYVDRFMEMLAAVRPEAQAAEES